LRLLGFANGHDQNHGQHHERDDADRKPIAKLQSDSHTDVSGMQRVPGRTLRRRERWQTDDTPGDRGQKAEGTRQKAEVTNESERHPVP
jgi:hypothetical protein